MIRPAVFITLYNAVNSDTFAVARENGIRYISADVTSDLPPYDIYERPRGRHTLAELCTPSRTFASVVDRLQKYGFAVVTVHPRDFEFATN